MPAFGDSYRTNNPYQQRAFPNQTHHQQYQHQFQNSQRSVSPPDGTHSLSPLAGQTLGNKGVSSQFSTVLGVGSGGAGGNYKQRIYPKELSPHSILKSTQTATVSPLLAALPNPTDLFARSFLSASPGTTSTTPGSLTGGSPPSSWPVSYTHNGSLPRGIGGSVPRNGGYPSFEENLSKNGAFMANQRQTSSPGDQGRLRPGDASYACSFDVLDSDENVLCFGWEGGLDVWRIGKSSLDLMGRLEGLSGGVRSAKILPTPQRGDPLASVRPLVVLAIQTPVLASSQDDGPSPTSSPPPSRPRSAASFTSSPLHHPNQASQPLRVPRDIEWQTSVEVYSLSTRERVAVLLTSPLEPSPATSMADFSPPPAWGGLRIEVGDKSIAVGIGLSGEVYLFTLVNIVTTTQTQAPVAPITQESPKKGKKGKSAGQKKTSSTSSAIPPSTEVRGEWVCQGKVWTTVQIPTSGSFPADNANSGYGVANPGLGLFQNGSPVFSLEGRWLSYSPPPANSSISAGAVVRVSHGLAASSVMTHVPPPPPPITAQVDTSDGEEKLINRMARGATQEMIRGAKWVGEHGMKAWQNYWSGAGPQTGNGPQPYPAANSLPSVPNGGSGGFNGVGGRAGSVSGVSALGQQLQRERQMQQMGSYPSGMASPYLSGNGNGFATPTTGAMPPSTAPQNNHTQHQSGGYVRSAMHGGNDLIYVSILDLGKFPSSMDETHMSSGPGYTQCAPFATFQPPFGASYLSFAPGGLALLTVSGKGDVYSVWDLMRVVHKSGSHVQGYSGSSNGPPSVGSGSSVRHVRLMARFTRMTVARIVDVAWSFPRGDKLAVVTDRGTVHFYDLPYNAYQWPPYRKPPPSSASANASPVFNSQQAAGVVQAVQGAVSLLGSTTQPLLTAARRRRPSNNTTAAKLPSPTGGIFVNYGNSRGRESTSEGAGSSGGSKGSYLPTGVDKVSLPGNLITVSPGLVKFLVGKEKGKVAMMGGGLLCIYQNTASSMGGSKKRTRTANGILLESGVAYDLPGLPDNQPIVHRNFGERDQLIEQVKGASGYWNGKTHHNAGFSDVQYRKKDEQQQYLQHPLSFAEIETTPVYPPFHTDRHATLMVFSDVTATATTSSMLLQQAQLPVAVQFDTVREDAQTDKNAKWVFGLPMKTEKLNLGGGKGDVEFLDGGALEDVADAMESRLKLSAHLAKDRDGSGRVVVKSRRKKRGKNAGLEDEDGFFEEDCVLDFTSGM